MATEGSDTREARVRTVDAADVDAADILGSAIERREDDALLTGGSRVHRRPPTAEHGPRGHPPESVRSREG
jgi:hypothetical protein